ncbi:MAG: M1 family metallopeptidase, partial [Nitrospira sp.]|nr:M1 family metallopeptidase [Nitrospira sp.]
LNEAFATFMEMLAVDAWKPEWQRWASFGVSRAAALSVDGLHHSRPIEYPVRAPREADAMFDVLTYEKGASVLRMLEQHIGPRVFRDGVRLYLRRHAHRNADTKDLWEALGEAARQPVPSLMDGWIFQPGYPLITVSLSRTGGSAHLVFKQERFSYLPSSALPPSLGGASQAELNKGQGQKWQVPIQLRITSRGTAATHRLLLTEEETSLPLPEDFEAALINEGGHGFYRVRYTPELLELVLSLAPDGLAAVERFNLINDAWASTVAGLMSASDYLDLTARFRSDRDKNVWAILIESFHALYRLVDPASRSGLEALVRDRVGPAVADLGWQPRQGEDEITKQLRGDLIRALGTVGNDREAQSRAAELFASSLREAEGGAKTRADRIDPNVVSALIAILAYVGGQERYEEFLKRFRTAPTPQEERRYLYALAAFQPQALLERTLASTLNGDLRMQDAPFIVRLVLMNVYGREPAWNFVQANWEQMDKQFPKQGLRRMCEGFIGLATPELERDVHRFIADRKIDLGGKTLDQYLEQLRIAVTFRSREGGSLSRYLDRLARTA